MKFPSFILLLTATALASVNITSTPHGAMEAWYVAENGAPAYSFLGNQNTLELANHAAASCCFKGNRCYRALERAENNFGMEFCKWYTKIEFKDLADMGPFQRDCWYKPEKLSWACSCFAPPKPPPPPEPECGPPGAPCTIDNFLTACCRNPDGSVGCYFPGGDPQAGICFN